jgi:hypothetical protein
MIFRQSPGLCKAASVGGLAYRHIGYFIPLLIGHRDRKALIARFFCKLAGNLSGMSPRGFEVSASAVGLVAHPRSSNDDVEAAARALGLQLYTAYAATEDTLDAAFASLAVHRIGAVLISSDPALFLWRRQIIALVARAALPAIYDSRGFVTDGGLMSYGASAKDAHRRAGTYVARIIRGEKPADLPVVQPTKFELVINLRTAKAFGLNLPPMLLAVEARHQAQFDRVAAGHEHDRNGCRCSFCRQRRRGDSSRDDHRHLARRGDIGRPDQAHRR